MNKQAQKVMFSSKSEEWETPSWIFAQLNAEFGFILDAAATVDNRKCTLFISKSRNALEVSWRRYDNPDSITNVFVNPPYSRKLGQWVAKAAAEAKNGCRVVMLLPARTDTKWFHEHIYNKPRVDVRFLKGRLKFGNSENSAPFPSMVVVFWEQT